MRHPHQQAEAASLAFRKFLQSSIDGERDSLAALSVVTSQLPLNNFDAWESMIRIEIWQTVRSAQAARWKFWKATRRSSTWLDFCNADGFARERSFRSTREAAPDGFLFSLALRRLNDWVPQVRHAAREHIHAIAARSQPSVIADALWGALPNVFSWGRMEDEDRQVFFSLAAKETVAPLLKNRIIHATSGPSTKILVQIGRIPVFDPWLDEISTESVQPATRAKAYRCLFEHRTVWPVGRKWVWTDLKWCKGTYEPVIEQRQIKVTTPVLDTLKAAIADRSSIVRRIGAEILIKEIDALGDDANLLAKKLASDHSKYVSERGEFALTKLRSRPMQEF